VILTSNRSREIGDALRRRCLYLFVDHPSLEKEVRILQLKAPGVSEQLAREIGRFMLAVRRRRLSKMPGVAEAIDWAQALLRLHRSHLDADVVAETLGCFLKDRHDVETLDRAAIDSLVAEARGVEA
jgi:MoxR-like ATPase